MYVAWPVGNVCDEVEQVTKGKVSLKSGSQTERLVGKVGEGGRNAIGLVQLLYHIMSYLFLDYMLLLWLILSSGHFQFMRHMSKLKCSIWF